MQLDETLDRLEQAVAQAALMGAAGAGGNQVDIAFAHRLAFLGKGHAPRGTLAIGKAVVLRVGKALGFKQGNHRLAMEGLQQVVAQATLIDPALCLFGFLVDQGDGDARHQHRLAAQQVHQLGHGQVGGLKVTGIGPDPHRGAGFAVTFGRLAGLQRLDHIAARKRQLRHHAFTVSDDFEPLGQRIGHAHSHSMQAAGEAVGAALPLVELAPSVQAGKDQFNHRRVFFSVQAERNAAPVVLDAHSAIGVQDHADFFPVPSQRFVSGVVQHLLDHMQGVVGAGVHARALLDRLQPLEHADRRFGIFDAGFDGHSGGL